MLSNPHHSDSVICLHFVKWQLQIPTSHKAQWEEWQISVCTAVEKVNIEAKSHSIASVPIICTDKYILTLRTSFCLSASIETKSYI